MLVSVASSVLARANLQEEDAGFVTPSIMAF
jgi:hypothetical protein